MFRSPFFTVVTVLTFLVLAAVLTMQVLEMRDFGILPVKF